MTEFVVEPSRRVRGRPWGTLLVGVGLGCAWCYGTLFWVLNILFGNGSEGVFIALEAQAIVVPLAALGLCFVPFRGNVKLLYFARGFLIAPALVLGPLFMG